MNNKGKRSYLKVAQPPPHRPVRISDQIPDPLSNTSETEHYVLVPTYWRLHRSNCDSSQR